MMVTQIGKITMEINDKWLDSRFIFNVNPTIFADRLDEGYKGKRLGHHMEFPSTKLGEAANRAGLGENQKFSLVHDSFEMSIRPSK